MINQSGYVIVEGNIGSGKSTFSKHLVAALNRKGVRATYLPELNETNNPFLAKYYADPKRYAFTMQEHLLGRRYATTQYAQWGALSGQGWFVMDRSYFGDLCFANVQQRQRIFEQDEFDSYVFNHKCMQTNIHFPTAAIFLRCDINKCKERIAKRMTEREGRRCECAIEDDYLRALQMEIDRLEQFMGRYSRVISRDWNDDIDTVALRNRADAIAGLLLDDAAIQRDFYTPWGGCANALFKCEGA